MKLKMQEIRNKQLPELESLLKEAREELRQLKTKAALQDLKDVRAIRRWRLVVARVITRLREIKNKR